MKRVIKVAEYKVCDDHSHPVVYIDSIPGEGTEFDSLDGYYCCECNAFWREP